MYTFPEILAKMMQELEQAKMKLLGQRQFIELND
jgi:hypothetical protein